MCNGVGIFKFICLNMFFLKAFVANFVYNKSFDILCQNNDSKACIYLFFSIKYRFSVTYQVLLGVPLML